MKYKCIAKCFVEGSIIMNPGDRIVIKGNKLFNVTTGVDYCNIQNMDKIMSCLVTDSIESSKHISDVTRFETIINNMLDTFKRKNHDYGDSFRQSMNEEGLAAARIRMGDKWNRFKNLSKGNIAQVNDESIRDTLLDLAVYSIITMIWLDKNGDN